MKSKKPILATILFATLVGGMLAANSADAGCWGPAVQRVRRCWVGPWGGTQCRWVIIRRPCAYRPWRPWGPRPWWPRRRRWW